MLAIISILCLKIRTLSNLPIFHSKQSIIILEFILLLAIICSWEENKNKIVETILWLNLLCIYQYSAKTGWFLKKVVRRYTGNIPGRMSPFLFVLAIILQTVLLRKKKISCQFKKGEERINHLLFIDNLKLFVKSENQLESVINPSCTVHFRIGY